MKRFLLILWQLPQYILGTIIKVIIKAKSSRNYKDAKIYYWNNKGGMSLATNIFVHDNFGEKDIMHEYGHTIQSRYLGWFYLIIIGLPSFIWASCFEWYRKKTGTSYYDFYTEQSADKLGGVDRNG